MDELFPDESTATQIIAGDLPAEDDLSYDREHYLTEEALRSLIGYFTAEENRDKRKRRKRRSTMNRSKGSDDEEEDEDEENSPWNQIEGNIGVTPTQVVAALHMATSARIKDIRKFLAVECYAKMLSHRQSHSRNVYNPVTFTSAMLALKRRTVHNGSDADGEELQPQKKSGRGKGRGGKGRGGKRGSAETGDDENADENAEGELEVDEDVLAPWEPVYSALQAVVEMLDNFAMAGHEDAMSHVIDTLSLLVQVPGDAQNEGARRRRGGRGSGTLSGWERVAKAALRGFGKLLEAKHGNPVATSQWTFKALLPAVLMTYSGSSGHVPVPWNLASTSTLVSRFMAHIAAESNGESEGEEPREENDSGRKTVSDCVEAFLKHVCVGAAQARKAEYRAQISAGIMTVLPALTMEQRRRLVTFVCERLSKSPTPHNRSYACEISRLLLLGSDQQQQQQQLEMDEGEGLSVAAGTTALPAESVGGLVSVLVQRSSDKVPNVRIKAISSLDAVFATATGTGTEGISDSGSSVGSVVRDTVIPAILQAEEGSFIHSQGREESFVDVLQKRSGDTRSAIVRKAAIQSLVSLLTAAEAQQQRLEAGESEADAGESGARLEQLRSAVGGVLFEHCSDPSVAVRKACLSALASFVEQKIERSADNEREDSEEESSGEALPREMKLWLNAALPMCSDSEKSVQELAVSSFAAIILRPLELGPRARRGWLGRGMPPSLRYAWAALGAVGEGEMGAHLQRCCGLLRGARLIKREHVQALVGLLIGAEGQPALNKGGWLLLSELAVPEYAGYIDGEAVLGCWAAVKDSGALAEENEAVFGRIVRVVALVLAAGGESARSVAAREAFVAEARGKLERFECPPMAIKGFVRALADVGGRFAPGEWAGLARACTERLQDALRGLGERVAEDEAEERALARRVFTLGEVLPRMIAAGHGKGGGGAGAAGVVSAAVRALRAFCVPTLYSASARRSVAVPPPLHGLALAAVGKVCLERGDLAKEAVGEFEQEVLTSPSPAVRNNALVALADLCVQRPNLVEQHVGTFALGLMDPSTFVRRQALFLVTRLVKDSFIKICEPLFFYTLRLVADDDAVLARQAYQCLRILLGDRASMTYGNSFIEAIFHLNNYRASPRYNRLCDYHPGVNPAALTFLGALAGADPDRRRRRQLLYAVMLAAMRPEDKLRTTQNLATEILDPIAKEQLPMPAASELAYDALAVMASREIKIGAQVVEDVDEAVEVDAQQQQQRQQQQLLKNIVLTKADRKNMVETVLPVIMDLKHFLERMHSPLLYNIGLLFKAFLQDYKKEMQDILVINKQLASEIEYDVRQFKAATAATATVTTKAAAARNALGTPRPGAAGAVPAGGDGASEGAIEGFPHTPRVVHMCTPRVSSSSSAAARPKSLTVSKIKERKTTVDAFKRSGISGRRIVDDDSDSDSDEEFGMDVTDQPPPPPVILLKSPFRRTSKISVVPPKDLDNEKDDEEEDEEAPPKKKKAK